MAKQISRLLSMKGFGDNIYQRAYIKKFGPEFLCTIDTPFPEIYEDLENVYFERCETTLRTQAKNAKQTDRCGRLAETLLLPPVRNRHGRRARAAQANRTQLRIRYTDTGIMRGMEEVFKFKAGELDLPSFEPTERLKPIIEKKFAIVRPITVRTEWRSDSRNPLPEYLTEAVDILKKNGFTTVSIADVDGVNETFVGKPPKCDIEFNKGELRVRELLSLVEHSSFIVGGVGWIVPASIAYRKEACIIGGGWGHFNHPDKLMPAYDVPEVRFILPDNYCECTSARHNCNKTITNFKDRFGETLCKHKPKD